MAKASQKGRILEIQTPLGEDVLLLRSFTGREEMGRMFEFQLEMLDNTTKVLRCSGAYNKIPAQEATSMIMNFTNTTGGFNISSQLILYTSFPLNTSNVSGWLSISGRYAFGLFGFTMNVSNLSAFIALP